MHTFTLNLKINMLRTASVELLTVGHLIFGNSGLSNMKCLATNILHLTF